MSEKRSSRKKVLSVVENILALVLMIAAILWAINRVALIIEAGIGEWYNYTFIIGIGILSILVGFALAKGLLTLILVQEREKFPNEFHRSKCLIIIIEKHIEYISVLGLAALFLAYIVEQVDLWRIVGNTPWYKYVLMIIFGIILSLTFVYIARAYFTFLASQRKQSNVKKPE